MTFVSSLADRSWYLGAHFRSVVAGVWSCADPKASLYFKFNPLDFEPTLKTRLLILQPTPFCNINCDYCYLPNRNSKARMSLATIRHAAERLRDDELVGKTITVVWHAGEPLAMPMGFYESAVEVIQQVLGSACDVSHSIQTNATLINDRWCDLFKRHNFQIGVSVDGPADLHDRHRRTREGAGTHWLTMRGMELLRSHGIKFHAIAVVTNAALAEPDRFFDFFEQHDVHELGCNFDEAEGSHGSSSLMGHEEAHGRFLTRLLERSLDTKGRVQVREFVNAYRSIYDDLPTYRWLGQTLPDNAQVVPFALTTVACNGDFSTFSPELLGQESPEFGRFILGNVNYDGLFASARSERFHKLWSAIIRGTEACQRNCAYFAFCGGGAPANKFYENGDLASAETLYCRTMFQRPFNAALQQVERQIKMQFRPDSSDPVT